MTDPFRVNKLIAAQMAPEIRRLSTRFGDGIVADVGGGLASVRKGDPEAPATPGFYVSPELDVQVGDHVWFYDDGGFKLVITILNRSAVQGRSGLWTPALQFATPGNLVAVYTEQIGWWRRVGDLVTYGLRLTTSTWTWTTSSGNAQIAGLPFIVETPDVEAMCIASGWTKAGFTQTAAVAKTGTRNLEIRATGSGQALSPIVAADLPTAGTVLIRATGSYLTADP